MQELWPTYVIPLLHFYITFLKLQREWSTQGLKTLTRILLFWRMLPPFRGFKVEQKDTGWLPILAVNHNKILSYSLSTWINIVALVLLTRCVHWCLALRSGLCWSSNGFVKYLCSLNAVLKCRWGFQVKHPHAAAAKCNGAEKSNKHFSLVEIWYPILAASSGLL